MHTATRKSIWSLGMIDGQILILTNKPNKGGVKTFKNKLTIIWDVSNNFQTTPDFYIDC